MAVIITDSTSDLTLEQAEELNVVMLSLSVHFGQEVYLDKRTLTSEAFYEKLSASEQLPTTSLLNPDDFIQAFNQYPHDEIVVLTLSSKLSGTYQSAVLAKETLGRSDIYILDSGVVSVALALLVRQAVALNQTGMPAVEIMQRLEALSKRVILTGVVDTLKYLAKGGRIGKVSGYVGNMLHIKPVLLLDQGEIVPIAKARGDKDAFELLSQLVLTKHPVDETMPVAFAYAGSVSRLVQFMHAVSITGPSSVLGSVVGTHVGPGVVAMAYFETQSS